jgi:hypothetical protein
MTMRTIHHYINLPHRKIYLLEESDEGDVLLKGYRKKVDEQARFVDNMILDDVQVDELQPIQGG